jgi:hypothetical protein
MPGEAYLAFAPRWDRPAPRAPGPILDSGLAGEVGEEGAGVCKPYNASHEFSGPSALGDRGWGLPADLDDREPLRTGDDAFQYSSRTVSVNGLDYTFTAFNQDEEEGPDTECSCDTETVSINSDVRDGEFFTLHSSCGSMDEEIILAAWSLLVQNLDLVAEAASEYEPGMRATLQSEVLGREFLWVYWEDLISVQCAELSAVADYNPSRERLRLDADYLMEIGFRWDQATAAGGTAQQKGQACAAADLASTILHELVHADGYGADPADAGESTFLIENYFRYHLMKRLCVLGWGCCNWQTSTRGNFDILVGDSRFNSESHYISSARNVCDDEGEAC